MIIAHFPGVQALLFPATSRRSTRWEKNDNSIIISFAKRHPMHHSLHMSLQYNGSPHAKVSECTRFQLCFQSRSKAWFSAVLATPRSPVAGCMRSRHLPLQRPDFAHVSICSCAAQILLFEVAAYVCHRSHGMHASLHAPPSVPQLPRTNCLRSTAARPELGRQQQQPCLHPLL